MAEYEALPVRKKAVRWVGNNTDELLALKAEGDPSAQYFIEVDGPLHAPWPTGILDVVTVDGNRVNVPVGVYVVLDAKGFPYPCDAEVFEQCHRQLQPAETCDHSWVDARNSVVQSGEMCPKCGAIRSHNLQFAGCRAWGCDDYVYCRWCHKTHSVKMGEVECGPGCWSSE